jgi:hypothetical protein
MRLSMACTAMSALLVLSDAFSFFLFCRRALCCLGLVYVGLFSVRTFFFFFFLFSAEVVGRIIVRDFNLN